MPQDGRFQWIYVVYRWILALFNLIHFLWIIIPSNGYFFIYLSNWAFIMWNAYLLWSSTSVTIRYIQNHSPCCERFREKQTDNGSCKPSGCCGIKEDAIKWYEKIHWLLFTLGAEIALCVTTLYWALLFDPQTSFSHFSLVTHLFNGIFAIIDTWVSGIPVRLYHGVYLICFACLYTIFTGLYFAGGGSNQRNKNETYIYPFLNYDDAPKSASTFVILMSLFYPVLIHLIFYAIYLLRKGVVYLVKKHCHHLRERDNAGDEMKRIT